MDEMDEPSLTDDRIASSVMAQAGSAVSQQSSIPQSLTAQSGSAVVLPSSAPPSVGNLQTQEERDTAHPRLRTVDESLDSTESDEPVDEPPTRNTKGRSIYMNLERLSSLFDMSTTEYIAWLDSPQVKLDYDELYTNIIEPRVQARIPFRRPSLDEILSILLHDRRTGIAKFRRPRDRTDWTISDHYAFCFLEIRDMNINNRNGAFFRKLIPMEDINIMVFQTMLRLSYMRCQIRMGKRLQDLPIRESRS